MNARLAITLLLLLMPALASAAQSAADSASEQTLVGVWGQVRVFPPAGLLEVSLHKDADGYVARAGDETVRFAPPDDGVLDIQFPLGTGAFRGARERGSRDFRGHWISGPSTLMYSHFAAPLTLVATGRNRWAGQVPHFDQRFSIYITIAPFSDAERAEQASEGTSEGTNGALKAFMRNPERNQGVNTRLHRVTRNGADVSFKNRDGEEVLSGRLSDDEQTLSIYLSGRGGTYDLQRLTRGEANGYYPRRDDVPYEYQAPASERDGWRVASADSVGMSEAGVETLVRSIITNEASSLRSPYLHSLLVARRGKLVVEEYFHGYHATRLHDLRSATKSVTGLMVGIALSEQKAVSVDSAVYPLFGTDAVAPALLEDPKRRALTLRHLLTNTGGFDCDDNNYDSPGNEDRMQEQEDEPDWWRYTLNLPMVREPGAQGVYCSAGINLLGGVVSILSQQWLPAFFDARLARPLGIEHYQMNLDPLQRGYGGGGIRMRPRDFLKFGQLLLDGGKWQGQQVVPREFVERSMVGASSINDNADYGFTWWVGTLDYNGQAVDVVSATGNGGQMLVIVPTLALVVGFTGGNYGDYRTWSSWRDRLLPEQLFPSLQN